MTRQPTRIMLVEDNLADVELLKVALLSGKHAAEEFEITVADSLRAATIQLVASKYDVVLLDLGLPDSTGLETLRAFIADQSGLPVIVLTGMNDETTAIDAVNRGAQDFLVKGDFDPGLLRRSIHYSMERHRLEQERKYLSGQLLTAVGNEQQRIARELHDEVGQGLAGLNMMARSLVRKLRQQGLPEAGRSLRISEGIQDILDSFRRVLCGLSPVDIDQHGLPVALSRLCEAIQQTGVDCAFASEPDVTVEDNSIATHLYRIVQESITNAMKHAKATQLEVQLKREGSNILVQVIDDGQGFDPRQTSAGGMGLRILRHRSELIGGSLTIDSSPSGTTVTCEVGLYAT